MRARAYEDNRLLRAPAFEPVDQKEIATDVAFTVICPFSNQRMILPLRRQLPFVRNQEKHRFFELLHVEAPGVG